ncbi:protein arginine kinase [Chryseomicrobium palamuruense]|uniref:Protein-arginine kinase n=1 Tax=Chryseomicrobium palamuruense TaxID=682973 RepID=A0ABV8UVR8_9BACL
MDMDRFLKKQVTSWMESAGEHADIVMSTRIRLARNLEGYRFPLAFTEDEAHKIEQTISGILLDVDREENPFTSYQMKQLDSLDKQVLIEKHLISPALVESNVESAAVISEDESLSILINEEDHLRIQCILPGLQLEQAYEQAASIDRLLDKQVSYAFDEKYGYLTTCPTNTGTGLRASVMMHLPALTATKQMTKIAPIINRLGMVVRGIYGEGSEALGNVYQVSNQVTLGKAEFEILQELQGLTTQLIEKERESRQALLEHSRILLEDRLYRSLGTLRYARLLTTEEAASCLSDVRLAIDLGIITHVSKTILNECMIFMQPGFLQQYARTVLSPKDRDVFRAKMIRERLTIEEKGENSNDV